MTHLRRAGDVLAYVHRGAIGGREVGALSGDVLAHVGAFHVDDDTAVHARGGAVHVDVCAAR